MTSHDVVVPLWSPNCMQGSKFGKRQSQDGAGNRGRGCSFSAKPLARIRNRLKITCCSVMLARTVHAQARTAPGS